MGSRHLVHLDDAHIHQDVELGHGWGMRGKPFYVASSSPGLSARVSFHGLYRYNEGQVRLWPYPRATSAHTIDVLRAVHVYLDKYGPRPLGTLSEDSRRNLPLPGTHPLVRTHPENGRKTFPQPRSNGGDRGHGRQRSTGRDRRTDMARQADEI